MASSAADTPTESREEDPQQSRMIYSKPLLSALPAYAQPVEAALANAASQRFGNSDSDPANENSIRSRPLTKKTRSGC
jgi:hypothetical protein